MSDYPERIYARIDYDGTNDGLWSDSSLPRHPLYDTATEYIRSDIHNKAMNELAADRDRWVIRAQRKTGE